MCICSKEEQRTWEIEHMSQGQCFLVHSLTPWRCVLFAKRIIFSQGLPPTTGPYSELHGSSLHLTSLRSNLILFSHLRPDVSRTTKLKFSLLSISNNIFFLQSNVISLAFNFQPGGPGPCIYVFQWQRGPVIPPGTRFPFHCLLRVAGLHIPACLHSGRSG
jgi:hypothetical protein